MNETNSYKKSAFISIATLLIATLLSVAILPGMIINNVPRVYLPENAPAVIIDDKLREIFPNDQGIVLLFEDDSLYSDSFLLSLHNLTKSLEARESIQRVVSVTSQDHIEGTEDGFIVGPLIDIEKLGEFTETQRKERILGDRFAKQFLIAADASALAVVILPRAIDNSMARMALQDDIYSLLATHNLDDKLTAEAGQITTDVEQMRESISQNLRFIPMVVFIGLLMVWLLFRRVLALVLSAVALSTVISAALALFVLFKIPFNLISAILAPLLAALTIAALVHLFNAMVYASKRGRTGPDRVSSAMNEIRRPALFNALTTAAGFASLGLTDIPPIKSLGLVTSAGVAFIYLVVYHLLPRILAYFDKQPWRASRIKRNYIDRFVGACFHIGMRKPVTTLLLSAAVITACSPYLRNIVVETNLLEFFAPGHKTRVATEQIEKKLAGTGSLDIVFHASDGDTLTTPENIGIIKALQEWADQQPEVDKTRSFPDFIEEMHWGFHAQSPEYRSIPENPQLISQYLLIYDGTDLYDFIDPSYQHSRVSLSINIHGASEINEFMARARQFLGESTNSKVEWEIAGISRLFADQVDLLVKGQVVSMLGALVLIFVLMMIQWRSFKDSVICMMPNLSPVLLIFILMGAFSIWLDVATAMIASVAVGIAIDDTIHVYHGFIHRVRRGISPTIALARTYRQAGRAIVTTSIILCAQFLVLATSNFIPVQNFGLLTSIGLLAALLFDLLLLPAILVLVYPPNASNKVAPKL